MMSQDQAAQRDRLQQRRHGPRRLPRVRRLRSKARPRRRGHRRRLDGPFSGYLSPALTGFSTKLEPLGRRLGDMLISAMPRYAGARRAADRPRSVAARANAA